MSKKKSAQKKSKFIKNSDTRAFSKFVDFFKSSIASIGVFYKRFQFFLRPLLLFLLTFLIVRIDLSTKHVIYKYLSLSEDGQVVKNPRLEIFPFLALVISNNAGVSFGWFSMLNNARLVLSIISGVILFSFMIFLLYTKSKRQSISLCFIIGGGIGNLYDRIVFGYVRDFIDLHYLNYSLPYYNLADCFIVGGFIALFVFDFFFLNKIED